METAPKPKSPEEAKAEETFVAPRVEGDKVIKPEQFNESAYKKMLANPQKEIGLGIGLFVTPEFQAKYGRELEEKTDSYLENAYIGQPVDPLRHRISEQIPSGDASANRVVAKERNRGIVVNGKVVGPTSVDIFVYQPGAPIRRPEIPAGQESEQARIKLLTETRLARAKAKFEAKKAELQGGSIQPRPVEPAAASPRTPGVAERPADWGPAPTSTPAPKPPTTPRPVEQAPVPPVQPPPIEQPPSTRSTYGQADKPM